MDDERFPADFEVLIAALRLRAPEPVGGHVNGAKGVFFGADLHGFLNS